MGPEATMIRLASETADSQKAGLARGPVGTVGRVGDVVHHFDHRRCGSHGLRTAGGFFERDELVDRREQERKRHEKELEELSRRATGRREFLATVGESPYLG